MLSKSTVKYIQSLHQKKFRDQHHSFIAEGPKVVGELLASGIYECKKIFYTAQWQHLLKVNLANAHFQIHTLVEPYELEKISVLDTPNMVVAEFKTLYPPLINPEGRISFVLDGIRDPGNLGTIIRTADYFAIPQIICSPDCVDMYNSKVVQSTMASLGRVNIVYMDLPTLLNERKVPCYAATLDGKNVSAISHIPEGLIIFGNESKGISENILSLADEQISIYRKGAAESLNAAIAAAIIAYVVSG